MNLPPRRLTDADIQRARRVLMRRDPRLGAVITRVGRCGLADRSAHDPFTGLVRVILSQQLSGKAAETIFGRVLATAGGRTTLTPRRLLAVDPNDLRQAGVSRPKITYMRDLAERVRTRRLDLPGLETMSDTDVVEAITSVKGLGVWSAQMYLMFRLNRPDILPVGDLGIVKGMQQLVGMKRRPALRTMIRLAEPWRPYRSVASWYLWRILD